ncbi:NAD(P)-dependent oxidoreductase [Streptomyces hoynatensis]|uniref:NAD(P)-dependent oxidoreductase n=1 Tax=Streptomyces hoynatensis TaxID=1141874 RepID=A0A3A9ZGW3_9ACTN|nr:NAD(P)-dependent oxidoreductase [Streptomyces hoynatensis]RKN46934.1 NAD(P)-dependent oxidoreductase [Streptomyces hoynatensis]
MPDPLRRDRTHVGFAGLGNLGQAMALALIEDGWRLTVYDRVPDKAAPCAARGARVAAGPADLAGCDVLALAVPDDEAVAELLEGPGEPGAPGAPGEAAGGKAAGGLLSRLPEGALVLVHSTVLPHRVRELAARAAESGAGLLDAPVSGGAERAARGELAVMAGGAAADVERSRPLLDSVGSDVRHVGPSGAGAATKLANQLMMFAALAGTHEALDLATAYGVPAWEVLGVVAEGTGDSWVARHWGFFDEVARAYEAGGTPVADRPWSKDLWEITAAARAAGVTVPLAGLLAQTMADRVERHAGTARGR